MCSRRVSTRDPACDPVQDQTFWHCAAAMQRNLAAEIVAMASICHAVEEQRREYKAVQLTDAISESCGCHGCTRTFGKCINPEPERAGLLMLSHLDRHLNAGWRIERAVPHLKTRVRNGNYELNPPAQVTVLILTRVAPRAP